MNKKIFLVRKTDRMTYAWIATGDLRDAFVRVWSEAPLMRGVADVPSSIRAAEVGRGTVRVRETLVHTTAAERPGIVGWKAWQKSLLTFLMVFGPGLIVMEADNDAGAVSTYMQAGGQYGLHLLWLLVVLLPICHFLQDMVARLGIATGEGSYLRWKRMVIVLCLMDLTWSSLAYVAHPNSAKVAYNAIVPTMPAGGMTSSLVFLVIAIVGTTIAPWQLFLKQRCVVEKPLRFSDLKWARLDTLIGATFTVCLAGAMMLVCNHGFEHHVRFQDPAQIALALGPLAGKFVRNGVLLLMVNAAVLGRASSSFRCCSMIATYSATNG